MTMNREKCIEEMGSNAEMVHPNTLCTKNPVGIGLCIGDSGGPLITQKAPREVIGIASWTQGRCGSGSPDVYARVFSHLKFIRSAMILV